MPAPCQNPSLHEGDQGAALTRDVSADQANGLQLCSCPSGLYAFTRYHHAFQIGQ